ncbi:unnamed protein product [Cyprideis torosa]|uniref:Uncharacterized protein n=1 Tax=Cyprideis torosa TaxID=163714 RepID=A0A7R8ZTU1_9CRUS|nr:unnamed protein product [Cyprideis torosa]CAG0898795.1 unnamed protein product [Cyprideis torosa]
MFLLLIGAGFGIYTIYLVIVESESSEDASFTASLCGLFWLILAISNHLYIFYVDSKPLYIFYVEPQWRPPETLAWSPSRQEEGDGGEVQRQTVVSPSMFIMKDDSESVGTYSGASSKGSSVRRLRHPMVGITIHTQSSSDSVLLGPHSIDTSVNTLSTVTN